MLDIEYRILEKLYSSDSRCCTWVDILNAFLPEFAPHVTDSALHDLVDTGLVGSTSPSWNDRMSGSVFLTGKGCLELLAEMDARQTHAKIADQEKEARDYRTRKEKREKLTLLLSVFSFIVSVCAIVISIIQP